jgi:hypothetical protein
MRGRASLSWAKMVALLFVRLHAPDLEGPAGKARVRARATRERRVGGGQLDRRRTQEHREVFEVLRVGLACPLGVTGDERGDQACPRPEGAAGVGGTGTRSSGTAMKTSTFGASPSLVLVAALINTSSNHEIRRSLYRTAVD